MYEIGDQVCVRRGTADGEHDGAMGGVSDNEVGRGAEGLIGPRGVHDIFVRDAGYLELLL